MRPGGGKQKGSKFERLVCKQLSLWISQGKREDVFWRSAMSGGRATVALRRGVTLKASSGDVSAINSMGEAFLATFFVELKSYRNLNILGGIFSGGGKLSRFWIAATNEAEKYNKRPLLIAHQNLVPTFCLVSDQAMVVLELTPNDALAYVISWRCYVVRLDVLLQRATTSIRKPRVRLAG